MADIVYIVDPRTSPKRVTLRRQNDSTVNTVTTFPTVGENLLLVEDLRSGKYNISNFILKPKFTTPLDKSVDYRGVVKLLPYKQSSSYRLPHTRTIIELSTDRAFNNIIRTIDSTSPITNAELLPLTSKTKNYLRARHISGVHMSDWSDTIEVEVAQLEYVATPYIILPQNEDVNQLVKHLYIKTSPFVLIGALDAVHEYTEYQISKNILFTDIVDTNYVRNTKTDIVLSNLILGYDTEYFIRVRYKGSKYNASDWSDIVKIKTQASKVDLGVDGLVERLGGNDIDGAYYGIVPNNMLIDRDYRGSYNNTLTYYNNHTVMYKNNLYKSIRTNKGVLPTNEEGWELDTRDGLPTYKWLADSIGIGYGLRDNNVDGNTTESPICGTLVNDNESWLKTVFDERLIYISKKPIITNISWNDLSKNYLTSNHNRTIRIGSRLYYVRLISETEYDNIFIPLTNGDIYNLPATDVDLYTQCWVDNNDIGITRKVKSSGSSMNLDAGSRIANFRVVLELINKGEEPYTRIKEDLPKAYVENFQYDQYTDTGYFGKVNTIDVIYGNDLANSINLSAGTAININTDWLKFYWHGIVIYVPMKSIRYGILKEDLLSLNIVYGTIMSSKLPKEIVIGNNKFTVGLLTGSTKNPSENITTSGTPQSNTNFMLNVRKEIGKNSMWNELIYRVHGTFVDDVLENQGTLNYVELHGGVQIGENWDILGTDELGIAYGEGSNTICQEVNSTNTAESISRGYYFLPGIVRQSFNQRLPIFGWRPILINKIERAL